MHEGKYTHYRAPKVRKRGARSLSVPCASLAGTVEEIAEACTSARGLILTVVFHATVDRCESKPVRMHAFVVCTV